MEKSIDLFVLQSDDCKVHIVDICKDTDNKRFVQLDKKIYLNRFKVVHLRNHICHFKGVGDSDKDNLKLWKVKGVKSNYIKEQKISTEKDIEQKLNGKEMILDERFSEYFKTELDD